jgi:LPXTG-motif cell wall-anchored protein
MAKKTLSDLKKCPIDFLYLWATDEFIALLGSKARIIREKKYYQYHMLWNVMADNEKFKNAEDGQKYYQEWANELAKAMKDTYGLTPAEILHKLAMGEDVFGKDWEQGVYGVGAVDKTSFTQNPNVTVDPATGMILDGGSVISAQWPIYDSAGNITGYSYSDGENQYQSTMALNGSFKAYTYSDASGVQKANGNAFNASSATFWQNANNYMPIINSVLSWLDSIVKNFAPNNTILTPQNTTPVQTEWIETESDNTGLYIAGGIAVAAALALGLSKKKKK